MTKTAALIGTGLATRYSWSVPNGNVCAKGLVISDLSLCDNGCTFFSLRCCHVFMNCRELKGRIEDITSRLAANPAAALEERAAAAEGRAKQLAASLARKEVCLREAKQALEETKVKLDECQKAAGAGGGGGEVERQAKMIQRLRAEVGRKEQALQVLRGPDASSHMAAESWVRTEGVESGEYCLRQ